jgi:hypothetical protein
MLAMGDPKAFLSSEYFAAQSNAALQAPRICG